MASGRPAGRPSPSTGQGSPPRRGLPCSNPAPCRPATWSSPVRHIPQPRLKRIIGALKDANRETAFFLHTDGLVTELIPDFIEIGVDILNPIQPEVMDPAQVKRQYGDDLIFFGGISVQRTLPFGTPDDVHDEVKTRMQTIGAGGGYLMTPSHLVNPDIPWENIEAFFAAADQYGNYQQRLRARSVLTAILPLAKARGPASARRSPRSGVMVGDRLLKLAEDRWQAADESRKILTRFVGLNGPILSCDGE